MEFLYSVWGFCFHLHSVARRTRYYRKTIICYLFYENSLQSLPQTYSIIEIVQNFQQSLNNLCEIKDLNHTEYSLYQKLTGMVLWFECVVCNSGIPLHLKSQFLENIKSVQLSYQKYFFNLYDHCVVMTALALAMKPEICI